MDLRDEHKGELRGLLQSREFAILYAVLFRDAASEWRRALLTNPELSEAKRNGYVFALRAVREGIESCFEKAGAEMPEWLRKELLIE